MEQKPKELKRIVYKAPGHAPQVMHVDAKYLCNLKNLVANADIIEHVPMIPAIIEGSPIQICVDEDGHPVTDLTFEDLAKPGTRFGFINGS